MISDSPIVSVSIVTYRTDVMVLKAALETLAASTVALSVLVVDNSQDGEYFAALEKVVAVRCMQSPRNGGYGFGHNFALANTPATAPFHLILNPDVLVHAGCLERLVANMQAAPDVALALPLILNSDGTVQPLNKRDPSVLDLALRRFAPGFVQRLPWARRRMEWFVRTDVGYTAPSEIPYASGCFMLFRRDVLQAIGGFDERYFMYFEDADITRAARAYGRVMFWPEAVITHAWARGSHTNWRLMLHTIVSAYRYFAKWGVRLA